MLSSEDALLDAVEPYLSGASVLLVGIESWVRESGFWGRLQPVAGAVTLADPYLVAQGQAQGVYDAVVYSERLEEPSDVSRAAALLRDGGIFVAEAFTPDRLDERSLLWWEQENREFVAYPSNESLRQALDASFDVRHFEWLPAFEYGDVVLAEDMPAELWTWKSRRSRAARSRDWASATSGSGVPSSDGQSGVIPEHWPIPLFWLGPIRLPGGRVCPAPTLLQRRSRRGRGT
jgi:hypothetical protein